MPARNRLITRRRLLRMGGMVAAGTLLAACGPQTPQTVEKEVTRVVEKDATKVVEKVVTQVVEKAVTPTPRPLPTGQKVSLTIFRIGDSWDPKNAYLPLVEKATNLTLFYQEIPSPDYREKRNVVMASGSYPQVIQVAVNEPEFMRYYEDGILQPFDEYLQKYPVVRDAFPQQVWEALRQKDGKIYTIPRAGGIFPITTNYRQDWTEPLGLKEPQTLDEFTNMLKEFKAKDPGKIGSKLIPFVPNRLNSPDGFTWVEPILAAFGAPWNAWLPSPEDSNKLVYSVTIPAFKDGLVYLQGLLKDGLMDATYLVSKERGLFKYYAGYVGATTDWPQFVDLRTEAIRNAYPDAKPKLGYITGLKGPKGVQGGPVVTPRITGDGLSISVTTAASPAQIDALFRLIQWQWTEGYTLMTLGVEGKSYDVVNGRGIRRGRDSILKDNPQYDLYMLDRLWAVEPPKLFAFRRDNPQYSGVSDEQMAYVTTVLKDAVQNKKVINYAVNTNDPVIQDNATDIATVCEQFASKVILNPPADLNAEYNAFLQALEKANLAKVTAKVNELNRVKDVQNAAQALVESFLKGMEAK